MHPKDINKTAIVTPFGLWEWTKMSVGLRNAGCTFQHVIHEVLHDIPYIFCYIDDILVSSPTIEDHKHCSRRSSPKNNLTVNLDKCVLAKPTMTFLSHRLDSKGIRPLSKKIAAIPQFPPPMSKLDMHLLLCMCNFYRRSYPASPTLSIL